jgi:hypothetical protein
MKDLLPLRTPTVTPEELEAAYAKGLLRKEELVHGAHYHGTCRNARIARWHEGKGKFVHVRHKYGSAFLEGIRHPVDEKNFDVFLPVEMIQSPEEGRVEDEAFERFFAGNGFRGDL